MSRSRTFRRLAVGAALLVAGSSACSPDLPTQGLPPGVFFLDLTGDWLYTAPEVRLAGSTGAAQCDIKGARLSLTQIRNAGAFDGRSSGGRLTCRGALASLSGPLTDYPIGTGYTFNQFIAFDFGSPDWRHEGLVTTRDSVRIDSISGTFVLRNGAALFEGKFDAVRAPAR